MSIVKKMRAISFFTFTWLSSIAMAQSSAGLSSKASFTYPTQTPNNAPKLTINVVDTIVVQWSSNYENAWLLLWCTNSTADIAIQTKWFNQQVAPSDSIRYTPLYDGVGGRDWLQPYFCHWDLNYDTSENKGLNGAGMVVTSVASRSPITYAAQYTTPSAASTSSKITSATTAPTTASGSKPSGNNGLSTGAKAGIAVGVVVGVLALLALGFMVWRNKRKVAKLQSLLPVENGDEYIKPQGVDVALPYRDRDVPPHEMESTTVAESTDQREMKQTAAVELAGQPNHPERPPQELP